MFARGDSRNVDKICSATVIWLFDAILHIISSGYSLHIRLCWYTYSSVSLSSLRLLRATAGFDSQTERFMNNSGDTFFLSLMLACQGDQRCFRESNLFEHCRG